MSLPDYRNTLHLLIAWLVVSVRGEVVMNHRHLLALLIICPQTDSDRGEEGGKEESDRGGGDWEGWGADGEGEPKIQYVRQHLRIHGLPCILYPAEYEAL